jgi:hypothetical protein
MEPGFFLVGYDPLVSSAAGRQASNNHRLPPFIDGSIRREPDLEHKYPSISCLCRADKVAPRLQLNDVVAYMTNKGSFGQGKNRWRLTAVLRVHKIFDSHPAAARWYRSHKLDLPANCWVPGNPAQPLYKSHRRFQSSADGDDVRTLAEWDELYRPRSEVAPTFVVCKKLWSDLSWSAPIVSESILCKVFGKPPRTQNPGKRPLPKLETFLRLLGIELRVAVG